MGVWISLGAVVFVLGLMAWTSWGSRRALRKCLVLSIVVHVGLVLYGGRLNSAGAGSAQGDDSAERIQSIRVVSEDGSPLSESPDQRTGSGRSVAAWDRPSDLVNPSDKPLRVTKPEPV